MQEMATQAAKDALTVAPGIGARSFPVLHPLGPIEAIRMSGGVGEGLDALNRIGEPRHHGYAFLLIVEGSARLRHYGHEAVLEARDLVLINRAAPFCFHLLEEGEIVMLRVSPRDLRAYLPSCEHFCGRPLRASDGISEATAELVLSVLGQLETGFEPEFRSRIARNLLDTLATAFSIVLDRALDGSPVICDRNARVRLYIESNLRDPELKPSLIAEHLRMSSRYLRVIFAASKETVSAYILRRRLEECARELSDPKCDQLSITEIAFGWGFNSGPHFTRSFRNRFELSPREYRGLYRVSRESDAA
jgi:AraC-like DNA-binding protein